MEYQPKRLEQCRVAFQDSTIIAVVEISQSSWRVPLPPGSAHGAVAPFQDGDAQPDDEPLRVGRE
jgi:hypothetical protein